MIRLPGTSRTHRAGAALAVAGFLSAPPAQALERIELGLPLLDTAFEVRVSELRDPRALLSGSSDLAELDQATNGAIGRRLVDLFQAPLPLHVRSFANVAVGSPLLDQALLLVSALGRVDGLPDRIDSRHLAATLDRAAARGDLTLVDVLEAIPGQTAKVDLEVFLTALQRLQRQQQAGERLLAAAPAAASDSALSQPGRLPITRSERTISVRHRPQPLPVVVIAPSQGANGRLVLISHGLWDAPESFEGWAAHLAGHGYTVLLPRHPGSDRSQQEAMLAGKVPPPDPEDLRLRPLDMTAAIDAAAKLGLPPGVRTDAVVALGQSWGATTVLQLAGARPSDNQLRRRCENPKDPERNLSWVLQCSFLRSANRAAVPDPRVKAVVAVSPPMRLLFDTGAAKAMNARVLLVSGTRDWVVPVGPEAITPMAAEARRRGGGHQLVLAQGGDHFNLRSPLAEGGGPLRGLLLAWVNAAFAAGAGAAPAPGAPPLLPPQGWGDSEIPLVNVTSSLPSVDLPTGR
jgi:predicted dienelactone hydrolase